MLAQLADGAHAVSIPQLFHLSDLAGERLALFWQRWETLQVEDRRSLVQSLVELAEVSFEVNFDAIFRRLLDDPDAIVRTAAIEGLWENEELPLAGLFLNKLQSDPASMVRASAATALGRYVLAGELEQLPAAMEERITTELLTVLHLAGESTEVRRRAIESVSYACTPETLQAIEDAYYDEEVEMRISAVVAMGRSCDSRWEKVLLEELQSDVPAMRYEAAWACGELALASAVPLLARMLDDKDRQVGTAAIWALGQTGGAQARLALTDALEGADDDTQTAINEALAELELIDETIDLALYDLGGSLADAMDDPFLDDWGGDDIDYEDIVVDDDDWPAL